MFVEIRAMKKKQSGFTLIELVIVIVVLGILAAVAFPRFGSVDTDAKVAVTNAYLGAINSAALITFSKNKAPTTLANIMTQVVANDPNVGFTTAAGGSFSGGVAGATAPVCLVGADTVLTGTYVGLTFGGANPAAPTIAIPKELCSG
jgi:MSHA pilin protein MshA